MMFSKLTPMLRTWDINASVAFYRDVLGFTCRSQNEQWCWAHLVRDQVELMLSGPNSQEGDDAPQMTGSLYIVCNEVDELFASLQDRVEICYPIEDFEYGMREFAIYDNNGYLIQFGRPLD
jgi:catechol 2,3-dioxygenase-like lactoylglutathione lyase family enzyme